MKRCPYCAEEIQDAAIVCRFCNRNLPGVVAPPESSQAPPDAPAQPARRLNFGVVVGLAIVCGVLVAGAAAMLLRNTTTSPVSTNDELTNPATSPFRTNDKTLLQVSGGKGASNLSLTNLEGDTFSKCEVALLDKGDLEWLAVVPGPITSKETVHVDASSFRANDKPVPADIWENGKYFIVSCWLNGVKERRSVGLGFVLPER